MSVLLLKRDEKTPSDNRAPHALFACGALLSVPTRFSAPFANLPGSCYKSTGGMTMSDILRGLSSAQREAVTSTEGMVRVIAGAAPAKTRALTARFAYLVNEARHIAGQHPLRHLHQQVRERDEGAHTTA